MEQEELEQFILGYMDEHIEERIAQLTDDIINQRIRQYMEENGAAIENNGSDGEVPLVPDDYFIRNDGEHMSDTSVPMATNSAGVAVSYIQARIRAFARAAATFVDASDVVTPIVEQLETDVTIDPNVMNVWTSEVSSLTIAFGSGPRGKVAHYMMQFTPASGFTMTLPRGIRWVNGDEPDWTDGSTYQVSIENGLAIYAEWEAEVV